MYHRFEENKYPSTNIRIDDFIKHIEMIKENKLSFINPKKFEIDLTEKRKNRKILLTIDDGFTSFYKNAWPILKERKIPFILFVSTREVGKFNYMTWDQIREIDKEEFVEIGNHSHTHEYLIDLKSEEIKNDIKKPIEIFKKELGYNSNFFSYPFGEYSNEFKKIIKDLGFQYAFGQHSGVISDKYNFYELPRFPINEKYGELKRFKSLLKNIPFNYEYVNPEERYLKNKKNPPDVTIKFSESIKNLNLTNCYSNEENKWRKSKIIFIDKNTLKIELQGKFTSERGRINCSLQDESGYWRWLGLQFVVP